MGANVVSLIGALILRYLTSLPILEAEPGCIYLIRFSSIGVSILQDTESFHLTLFVYFQRIKVFNLAIYECEQLT